MSFLEERVEISLIIPAYNEEESIPLIYDEAVEVLSKMFESFEILFVDDGSDDRTPEAIAAVCERDPRVRHLELARNAGKSRAYHVAFEAARGDLVATADADLQDDLNELPKMLEALGDDHDLIVGWKSGRFKNEAIKAIPSFFFNLLIYLFFGIRLHDSNCGFRLMRRKVARALKLYGGFYRFIPELAHKKGFRVAEVPVHHRKRKYGSSKYGPLRFWTGILDILSVRFVIAFTERPLHFFGSAALLSFLVGSGLEIYVLVLKISGDSFRQHLAALIVGVLFIIASVQIFTTGLLAEMLASRIEHELIPVTERTPNPEASVIP